MAYLSMTPMLEVQDMNESIGFYERWLSFKCVGKRGNEWARMENGKIALMLTERYSAEKLSVKIISGKHGENRIFTQNHESPDLHIQLLYVIPGMLSMPRH